MTLYIECTTLGMKRLPDVMKNIWDFDSDDRESMRDQLIADFLFKRDELE